jgi:hypothetical protein
MSAFRISVALLLVMAGMGIPSARGDAASATTKPVVSELEIQLIFPGSIAQGQIRARVRPSEGAAVRCLIG